MSRDDERRARASIENVSATFDLAKPVNKVTTLNEPRPSSSFPRATASLFLA